MKSTHYNDYPSNSIVINTDGSCLGNPGPGGWAALIVRYENGKVTKKREVKGKTRSTTNNRMELQAALMAILQLKSTEQAPTIIRSDSQYLVKGMNEWTAGWAARGWRKSNGKAVENQDLWQKLVTIVEGRSIEWMWVRGHAGDPDNDRVDQMAKQQARLAQVRCH